MLSMLPALHVILSFGALIGLAVTPLLVPGARRILKELNTFNRTVYAAALTILFCFSLEAFGFNATPAMAKLIGIAALTGFVLAMAYMAGLGVFPLTRMSEAVQDVSWPAKASLRLGAGLTMQAIAFACILTFDAQNPIQSFYNASAAIAAFGVIGYWISLNSSYPGSNPKQKLSKEERYAKLTEIAREVKSRRKQASTQNSGDASQ